MLTLDKALQSVGLFSFQKQQVPNSYYCELKDIVDAFEKLLDIEYIYTLKSKSSETGTKELHIRFLREHLYHLSGLQHFEDVVKLKLIRDYRWRMNSYYFDHPEWEKMDRKAFKKRLTDASDCYDFEEIQDEDS